MASVCSGCSVGFGFGCRFAAPRFAPIEQFSLHAVSILSVTSATARRTEIDIASSAGIKAQRCVACWALLGFEFTNVLVEAGFVRHMTTRQLQYTFAS